jgi:glycosyltransferase involved in cell wall biosynthesis
MQELRTYGFKRRNTILLKNLSEHQSVSSVMNFNYTNRKQFLKNFFKNYSEPAEKVKDIYFSEILVFGRFRISSLNRLLNKIYFLPLKRRYSKQGIVGWVYWPNGYHDYKLTGLNLEFVFDADHNLIEDPNLGPNQKEELTGLLREISLASKLVVCASKSMLEWFTQNGARQVHRLRNGIDLSRFSKVNTATTSKFSVVYCGILSHWVNYNLFHGLVESNPDIEFVVIGKSFRTESYQELGKFPNVVFMGEKSSEEVAALLPNFSAGLALYKSDTILDGDSMKIYEYLAAGLPVLCTSYHKSLSEDFENLLFVADTREEFNRLLQTLRNKSMKVDENSVNSFLNRSGWHNRVDEVLNKINLSSAI